MVSAKQFILERVLNLPAPKERTPPPKKGGRPAARPQTVGAAPAPTGVPWQIATESNGARTWRLVLRIATLVVLTLFAWVGVRETFFTSQVEQALDLPVSVTFDNQAASGVASRFAMNALTWDEDSPTTHAAGVALDYGTGSDNLGWNGKGRQDAVEAIPAGVAVAKDGERATVTVLVRLVSYERAAPDQPWEQTDDQWGVVEVPVAQSNGRMVATGAPAPVGEPAPRTPPAATTATPDVDLTALTRSSAESFFTAYGEGDVSAVEAPGATIQAPSDWWTFGTLTGWQAYTGTGDTRTATAEVTWTVPDEPQTYTVIYTVTLTLVSGGGSDRWQVSDVTTGSITSLS
jgi:hypothetical protein